jgi:hypothetical protein
MYMKLKAIKYVREKEVQRRGRGREVPLTLFVVNEQLKQVAPLAPIAPPDEEAELPVK